MTEITHLMQYTFRGNHRNISPCCSHTMHRRWVLHCIVTAEGTFRKTKTKRPFKLSSTSDLIGKTDVTPSEAFCTCKTGLLPFLTATITFPTKLASLSCYEDRYPILKFPVRKRGPKGKDSKHATKTIAHSFLEVRVARRPASQATSFLSTSAPFRYL